jgi:hypothetical protein
MLEGHLAGDVVDRESVAVCPEDDVGVGCVDPEKSLSDNNT